jgi:hypothetical protein
VDQLLGDESRPEGPAVSFPGIKVVGPPRIAAHAMERARQHREDGQRQPAMRQQEMSGAMGGNCLRALRSTGNPWPGPAIGQDPA